MADASASPPLYWYISFADKLPEFYRDEERLTEAEWREGAPADQVVILDRDQSRRN